MNHAYVLGGARRQQSVGLCDRDARRAPAVPPAAAAPPPPILNLARPNLLALPAPSRQEQMARPLLSGLPPLRPTPTCRACATTFIPLLHPRKTCYHCGFSWCLDHLSVDHKALLPRAAEGSQGGGYDEKNVCHACWAWVKSASLPAPRSSGSRDRLGLMSPFALLAGQCPPARRASSQPSRSGSSRATSRPTASLSRAFSVPACSSTAALAPGHRLPPRTHLSRPTLTRSSPTSFKRTQGRRG